MTFLQLLLAIEALDDNMNDKDNVNFLNSEVKIRADFPIDGRVKYYSIEHITTEGIVFDNDEVQKPIGH